MTAVFAPPPELLARSGRHPTPATGWEEPTRVVSLTSEALEQLASAPSHEPPSHEQPSAPSSAPPSAPTAEQLKFEQKLEALATPVPVAKRGRWLIWALFIMLLGAGTAVALEYTLHPGPLRDRALRGP